MAEVKAIGAESAEGDAVRQRRRPFVAARPIAALPTRKAPSAEANARRGRHRAVGDVTRIRPDGAALEARVARHLLARDLEAITAIPSDVKAPFAVAFHVGVDFAKRRRFRRAVSAIVRAVASGAYAEFEIGAFGVRVALAIIDFTVQTRRKSPMGRGEPDEEDKKRLKHF